MGQIFLGKWWHWVVLILVAAVMWWTGSERMHVKTFNPFLILVLVMTIVAVLALVLGSRPGERVTREELVDDAASSSADKDD